MRAACGDGRTTVLVQTETTNGPALRFYEGKGFRHEAHHRGAEAESIDVWELVREL